MEEKSRYQLKKSYLYPIVLLEEVLSSSFRRRIYKITVAFLLSFLTVIIVIMVINQFHLLNGNIELVFDMILPKIFGLVLLSFAFWICVYSIEAFFCSYYFKEKEDATVNGKDRIPEDMFSFHVLRILLNVQDRDITAAFCLSDIGREILHRSGLYDDIVETHLNTREHVVRYSHPQMRDGEVFALTDLAQYIFQNDPTFADFLFSKGTQKEDFFGATSWVVKINEKTKEKRRWWTAANLEKIEGIGSDWSYGQAYILRRYAHELSGHEGGASLNALSEKGAEYLQQLKDLLSCARESNVLLVGEPGEGKMDVVYSFARDIHSGKVPPALERKRPMLFDGEFLVSQSQSKNDLEIQFIKILNDAVAAGNILFIFRDLSAFVLSAQYLGTDVIRLMDPYFASAGIQIVALSNKDNYHHLLEQDPTIKQRFEHILVEHPGDEEMVEVLQNVAEELEKHSGVLFTYNSLKTVIRAVMDHFSDPVMPDKAIDILVELPAHVIRKHKILVEKQDILDIVEKKTGVPLGQIKEAERETLLNVEDLLHKRVIGQDEAIVVVSNAMRRSRAGVRNTRRPIGSFLFVGPTGVGKTETAKALAALFFGDEKNMTRLDMSEFAGGDAVARLIGSFDGGQIGVLTRTLREHSYGVVLLDEFEKSATQVHDLFLQILDEGFFSDVKGKRVNARNVIFIATSNAGSNLIFEKMQQEVDTKNIQKEIVDHIIKERIFKPEFLNRFDAVVLFHPLELEHIRKISGIMLEKLRLRLRNRGLDMEITSEMVEYVAQQGVDPVFGARPMNRYIQENLEQVIAEKLIRGDIKEGSKFTLLPEDLT